MYNALFKNQPQVFLFTSKTNRYFSARINISRQNHMHSQIAEVSRARNIPILDVMSRTIVNFPNVIPARLEFIRKGGRAKHYPTFSPLVTFCVDSGHANIDSSISRTLLPSARSYS